MVIRIRDASVSIRPAIKSEGNEYTHRCVAPRGVDVCLPHLRRVHARRGCRRQARHAHILRRGRRERINRGGRHQRATRPRYTPLKGGGMRRRRWRRGAEGPGAPGRNSFHLPHCLLARCHKWLAAFTRVRSRKSCAASQFNAIARRLFSDRARRGNYRETAEYRRCEG